jgi:hypothetical protein
VVYKRHVVIINGYGCHLDTPLKLYLDRVVQFLNSIPREVVLQLLFSGGPTQQKSAPGITEARLMRAYIYKHYHPERDRMGFVSYEEDTAFTTHDNISKAAEWLRYLIPDYDIATGHKFESTKITIFCEATRSATVAMLAGHFLLSFVKSIDDITVETASWERADPFRQVGSLIHNKLAIKYPWLGIAERERRHRMRRAREI